MDRGRSARGRPWAIGLEVDLVAVFDRDRHLELLRVAVSEGDKTTDGDGDGTDDGLRRDRLAEDDGTDGERPDEAQVAEWREVAGSSPSVRTDEDTVSRQRRQPHDPDTQPLPGAGHRIPRREREHDGRRAHADQPGIEQGRARGFGAERPGQQAEQGVRGRGGERQEGGQVDVRGVDTHEDSTPAKPTSAPAMAFRVTRSPSSGPASATMMSGVVDARVLTSASGSSESARKKVAVAPNMASPRASWVDLAG